MIFQQNALEQEEKDRRSNPIIQKSTYDIAFQLFRPWIDDEGHVKNIGFIQFPSIVALKLLLMKM